MRFCLVLSFLGKSTLNTLCLGTGVRVVDTLVVIYLGGCMLTILGVYAASRRWNDRRAAPNPLGVSLFAGAVWPLLLLGLVELGSVIVYAKVQSSRVPGAGIFA